jgi:hypothetical protein
MNRADYPAMTDLEWALTKTGWDKFYHGKGFPSPTGYHWKVWRPGTPFIDSPLRYVRGRGGNFYPAEFVEMFPYTYGGW